jgi:arylsulfatase A
MKVTYKRQDSGFVFPKNIRLSLFFVFYVLPASAQIHHFPWQGPDDAPHRKEGKDYAKNKWGIIPDKNHVCPHVKAMIESIDEGVGKILQTLKNLNLEENTLLIFTSDNGGYTHYADSHFNISSNGPLRGQKTEVYEGGHRVPFIAYWPGKIKPGTQSNEIVMTMDMFPTFTELAEAKIPRNHQLDGVSIVSRLYNNKALPERVVCWKIDDERAIRKGNWKLCLINDNPPELYDLANDIGETNNLATNNPELVNQLLTEYKEWEKNVTANYE